MWYRALAQGQDHLDIFRVCPWDPAPKWQTGLLFVKTIIPKRGHRDRNRVPSRRTGPAVGRHPLFRPILTRTRTRSLGVGSPQSTRRAAPVRADALQVRRATYPAAGTTTSRRRTTLPRPCRVCAKQRARASDGEGLGARRDRLTLVWYDLASWPQLRRAVRRTYAVPVEESASTVHCQIAPSA